MIRMASLPNEPNITIRPDTRDQALKFFWSAPTPNGSPPVLSYRLTDGATNTINLPATTSFYTYSGLTNGTSYTFRIAASNAVGLGPFAFFRTVQPGLTPGIPVLSTVISTTASLNYTVGWSNPSDLGGATNLLGTLLTAYPVDSNGELITISSLFLQQTVIGGNSNSFQEASLSLTSNYNYKVLIAPVVDAGYGRIQLFTSTISSSLVAPPVFSPSSIDSMQLWLDATDIFGNQSIPTNGSTIATWVDKSGRGYNAIGQSNPVFSTISSLTNVTQTLNTIYFNTKSMNAGVQTGSNYSLFMTVYSASAAGYQRILNGGGNLQDNILFVGTSNNGQYTTITGNITAFSNIGPNAPAITVGNTMSLLEMVNIQTTHTPYVFGSNQNQKSNAVVGFSSINIGGICPAFAGTQAFTGYLGEILFYSTAVGATTRNVLEGYLAWKWGLSTLLPTWHPFYTRKPEITDSNLDFSPSSVTNLNVWLDAQDSSNVSLSGNSITGLTDKSSNAYSFTGANGFTYNSTLFQGQFPSFFNTNNNSQNHLGSNMLVSIPQPMTFFMVGVDTNTGATSEAAFDSQTGVNRNFFGRTNNGATVAQMWAGAGDNGLFSTAQIMASSFMMSCYYSTTNSRGFLNGSATPYATGNVGLSNLSTLLIGNRFLSGGINQAWTGHICEMLFYRGALAFLERQRIEGYLAWKWGLQSNLPLTHLYVQRAPTRLDTFTSFSPSSITGLTLWLDAADANAFIYSSGNVISQWTDKSGSNNHMYSSGSNIRTNDGTLSTVLITPSSFFSTTNTFTINTSTTIHIVLKQNNPSSIATVVGVPNGLYSIRFLSSILNGTTSSPGDTNDFGNAQYFINGSNNPATTANTFSTSYGMINARSISDKGAVRLSLSDTPSSGLSRWIRMNVAEVLVYNGTAAINNRTQIEGYLAWKWGIQATMPITHPFYYGSTVSLGPLSS